MRQQEEEFLRQIHNRPEDDDLRLVFADWLEEIGDERAELIRVQCETARLEARQEPLSPEQREHFERLKTHEAELARLWRESCLEELSPLGVRDVRFERGFVARMLLEGTDFLNRTKNLAEWAPAPTAVLWQKMPRQSAGPIQRFLDSPAFSTVHTLNLSRNHLGAAGVEALASSPQLARIGSLSLAGNVISGQNMRVLAQFPNLSGLTRLDLSETELSMVDARTLAQASSLHQLKELLLNANYIGDAGLRALTNAERLRTLRRLDVAENRFHLEGIRALTASAYLTDLQSLDVSVNEIGDAGLELLASAGNFGRLTELRLAQCEIRDAGIKHLINSPYLKRLKVLDLSANDIQGSIDTLVKSPLMEQLKTLVLEHCGLGGNDVSPFVNEPMRLEWLDLRGNLFGPYSRDKLIETYGERVLL